ncbi:MAG: hypothetical protein QG614_66 [Patescibacteria group bacterium]|nr:hypothetical protein [Patescibacteria group bacterium]MDQ5957092.1 hypothetical protein [Patescibacteria group bacterium]
MNTVYQIEALLSILLAALEMQINTLHFLGPHHLRPQRVSHTKQLIQALLNLIEKIEQELILETELESEEVIGDSVSLMNILAEAKKEVPNLKSFEKLSKEYGGIHASLTALLAAEEQNITAKVAERFAKMQESVRELLFRIDKM